MECDYKECDSTFHITCAAEKEIIVACDRMLEDFGNSDNADHVGLFCLDHIHMGRDLIKSDDKA